MSIAPTAAALVPASAAVAATCAHCDAALPPGGAERFCCPGCAGAHAAILRLGLGRYYQRRALDPAIRTLRPQSDAGTDYAAYVAQNGEVCTLDLMVDGLHCAACLWLIESVLARCPEVIEGRVNLTTRRLRLRWRGAPPLAARLTQAVTMLGYRLVPFDPEQLAAGSAREERELLRCLAVAGFAAANVMLLSVSIWAGQVEGMGAATRDLMHWVSALIALPAIAYAGQPFFRSALRALKAGRTNMDVPISIGVTLAAGLSLFETAQSGAHAYFDSAVTLLFFLLVGRYLDRRARGLARGAAEHLLALAARSVTVIAADGTLAAKAANAVAPGATVLVAAGERIGVDGMVADGESSIDTSLVTGEATPRLAARGTGVFAGMLNLSAPLRVTVTAAGEGTLLAEIVRLMEAAERGRTRFVALADRVARAYAPVVHVLAAATFAGWIAWGAADWHSALLNAVAVLIITCPCALALAVPAVQVIASGRLLRRGILLKSATALERLARIDTVVFDKTGTLTVGRPELIPDPALAPADLRLAASLAGASRHPLARALARAAPAPVAPDVREHPGSGLSRASSAGEIRLGSRAFCGVKELAGGDALELWLSRPDVPPVRFAFRDRLRDDAAAVVARLQSMGLQVELLSGDRPAPVAAAAREAGIAAWRAEADPAAKCARLAELAAAGRRVLMVGDGLNDAPALAAAHVSLSPATAADIAQIAADLVFQGDALAPVAEAIVTARRGDRVALENLGLALLYNLAAVPLAIAGYVTPLVAAIAMSSSSLLVIGNALRLARGGRR
jgi:Cu2+-exporting ATPase